MVQTTEALGKRKRETEQVVSSRRAIKRKRKVKSKEAESQDLDTQTGVNQAIGHMDASLLADYTAQSTRRFEPELSSIELEDLYVSGHAIRDTSDWKLPRSSDTLAQYLENFTDGTRTTDKLASAPKSCGHPHTIVVTAAALRAADLTRSLRKFQTKDAVVAKLFAKHIKLKDAVEMVKKTRIGIGVGTPQRLLDLFNDGAMSTQYLERIVIDASHINEKKKGIFDMKETEIPLVRLLGLKELRARYNSEQNKISLLFF